MRLQNQCFRTGVSYSLIILCLSVRKAVVGGMSSGAIGQFLASPTDLVKVQMQMEGRRVLEGKPPRFVQRKLSFVLPVTIWAGSLFLCHLNC